MAGADRIVSLNCNTERLSAPDLLQALIALTRAVRRDTLRAAVRLWMTPFWAVRTNTGSVALRAAAAAALSPDAIASSTLRTSVFRRELRALLTAVRRIAWRAAFLAEDVLAIFVCFPSMSMLVVFATGAILMDSPAVLA